MAEQETSILPNNPNSNSDSITRAYLDSLGFEERLIGSAEPTTQLSLFGVHLDTPLMTAAMSGLDRFSEQGALKMAEAVRRLNSIMWMGISEDAEVEAVASTGVHTIEIIKPYAEADKVFHKIEHAKRCGCIGIGMDIDHCFAKDGTYGTDRPGNPMHAKTVADIRSYVDACEGTPFIVKGILSVRDALMAAEAGASAIVLSHHHNIFPFAVPPLLVLPEIRNAVGDDMTIIADSCIKDGYDAFKALALGADGVGVGRALQVPLVKRGADGVHDYLSAMTAQLKGIMARTGTVSLAGKDPTVIRKVRF